ncbi:MAG: Rho termination factor N-terminal domain-containing protein [Rubricoccaceae bacterium]|nr:Rho termination factor N-terminal domain-containing protein [Rubricoccaceae bacterium]
MSDRDLDEILDQQDVDPSERPDDYDDAYTEPALRWRLKEAIQASGQGGEPGEWSARKAQRLVQEYERRGGGYRGDKSASQRSLEAWTQQDWQTAEGSADAASGDGMSRYLPRDAWALLTESAREEAERSKQEADDQGEQYADWPDVVHRVMNELGYTEGGDGLTKSELYARAQELDVEGRSDMTKDELKTAILDATRDAEGAPTKDELYTRAQALGIGGRSQMTKAELKAAVAGARSA